MKCQKMILQVAGKVQTAISDVIVNSYKILNPNVHHMFYLGKKQFNNDKNNIDTNLTSYFSKWWKNKAWSAALHLNAICVLCGVLTQIQLIYDPCKNSYNFGIKNHFYFNFKNPKWSWDSNQTVFKHTKQVQGVFKVIPSASK